LAVERSQSHCDDLLHGKAANSLSQADCNLATALVLGVLRWQILLDHRLRALFSRPNAKLDLEVLIALRLGAFQLLYLDRIPVHAAIDESVELVKQFGHRFASGMVNAVLRKLAGETSQSARQPAETLSALKEHSFTCTETVGDREAASFQSNAIVSQMTSSAARLSLEEELPGESSAALALSQAHPAWMVERWIANYGFEATRDLCRHGQSQPSLTLRIHDPAVADELAASAIHLQPGELLTVARTVVSGDVTASAAYKQGRLRFQDEGSQLIAELAGSTHSNPVRSILDCCAAPGGKTLILAQRNPTARIVACESSPQRFEALRQRLGVLGERIECLLADATSLPWNQDWNQDKSGKSGFDLALADVPCSGTGTLGRNPEIRHRLRPEDLARQAERQRALLLAAMRAIRPGGRVVYSTCSLEPEENEQVVAAALAEAPAARLISLESRIDSLLHEAILTPTGADRLKASLTPAGALRLLPGAFHTDGFFIALLERIA
jgi:16S rRNA (cytosine967-C5)-methyltransferase